MATIIGGAGSDVLLGTFGDDFIDTGGGFDQVDASQGDDVVRISGPIPVGNPMPSSIQGGPGHDILDLTAWQGHLIDFVGNGYLTFAEWNADRQDYTGVAAVQGFEEVHLGTGVQYFTVYDEGTSDAVPGSLQGWTIIGSNSADNITDSRGYDTIKTGDGDDSVHFRGGNDQVSLGNGNDIFVVDVDTGFHDQVVVDGGAGTDVLDIQQTAMGSHIVVDLAAGTGQIGTASYTLTNFENINARDEAVGPEPGLSIKLAGGDEANNFNVKGGADTVLLGRGGDDALLGYEA